MGYKSGELEWNLLFMGSIALGILFYKAITPVHGVSELKAIEVELY